MDVSNIHIGLSAIVEQPIERGWERKAGYFTVRRWSGTQSQCEDQRDDLIADGGYSSVVLRELDGGVWSVDARLDSDIDGSGNPSPDSSVVDTWELTANRVEKDVLAGDTVAGIEADNLNILRDFADGRKTYSDYEGVSPAFTGETAEEANALWEQMREGLKATPVFAPVLRKNQTVSNGYVIASALSGVGRIWTTTSLLGAESVPPSIANNLPGSSTQVSYVYGWIKGYPSITAAIGGKVQLQQEWEYGLWSTVLYGAAL
jgi:hypothetical protein